MDLSDSLQDLHDRYVLQAKWTAENRRRLYASANIDQASRVLEVGSGTSAVIHELSSLGLGSAHGIDIDPEAVFYARSVDPRTRYIIGDGSNLPYFTGFFDAAICHFLLMWVRNPLTVLQEMRRVIKFGGVVLALAEPDYGGRIDFPEALEFIGQQQAEALESQGADTQMGRKLRMLFTQAGLENIHVGIMGGEWHGFPDETTLSSEWETLKADVERVVAKEQLEKYHHLDRSAWMEGIRVLFVPTFYAIGWHKARL